MFLNQLLQRNFLFDTDEGGGQPVPDTGNNYPPAQDTPAPAPKDNWEKRYKGLQTHADTLKKQLDALTADHRGAVERYEGELSSIKTERDTALTAKQELERAKAELQNTSLSLKKQLDVVSKITSDPGLSNLMPFLSKGLLAVGNLEGEELDKYLRDYADTLGNVRAQAVTNTLQGSTPPAPTGAKTSASMSEDELYDELMATPVSDPKYPALYKAYMELGGKKDGKS